MPALLLPPTMRPCSASSRSFLLGGPDGPACGGSTWTSPALRRSYRARENRGRNKIRITKVSTVSGEPRPCTSSAGCLMRQAADERGCDHGMVVDLVRCR